MTGKERNNSFLALYRSSLTSPVFQRATLWHVWSYCLLRANFSEQNKLWNGEVLTIKPGQFIFGRFEAAKDLHMKPSTLWGQMLQLKNLGNIDIKTNTKFSVITICNWGTYQQQRGAGSTTESTTSRQQADTDNKDKKEKNTTTAVLDEIVKSWNALATDCGLATIKGVGNGRTKAITARLSEPAFDFKDITERIRHSEFVRGKNDRGWKIDFDWIFLSPNNYLKLLEGKYDSRVSHTETKKRTNLADIFTPKPIRKVL